MSVTDLRNWRLREKRKKKRNNQSQKTSIPMMTAVKWSKEWSSLACRKAKRKATLKQEELPTTGQSKTTTGPNYTATTEEVVAPTEKVEENDLKIVTLKLCLGLKNKNDTVKRLIM